jgi:hypothetical protein
VSIRDRIEIIVMGPHESAGDCADAILADPEIAALREVAELSVDFKRKVTCYIYMAKGLGDASDIAFDMNHQAGIAGNKLDAALARLEEARK